MNKKEIRSKEKKEMITYSLGLTTKHMKKNNGLDDKPKKVSVCTRNWMTEWELAAIVF